MLTCRQRKRKQENIATPLSMYTSIHNTIHSIENKPLSRNASCIFQDHVLIFCFRLESIQAMFCYYVAYGLVFVLLFDTILCATVYDTSTIMLLWSIVCMRLVERARIILTFPTATKNNITQIHIHFQCKCKATLSYELTIRSMYLYGWTVNNEK